MKALFKFLAIFLSTSFCSVQCIAQNLPYSNFTYTGQLASCTNAPVPSFAVTIDSTSSSYILADTLYIPNICDTTVFYINLSNLRWNRDPDAEWLHGICITQPTVIEPFVLTGVTDFLWMPNGCVGQCSLATTGPPGYYFDGTTAQSCCPSNQLLIDSIPQNNYGQLNYYCGYPLNFGIEVAIPHTSFFTGLNTFEIKFSADGATGCWTQNTNILSKITFKFKAKVDSILGPSVTVADTTVLCNGTGALIANISNSMIPTTWWSNGDSGAAAFNLNSGMYVVYTSNSTQCIATDTAFVFAPDNTDTTYGAICLGDSFTFNGSVYNTAGVHTQQYTMASLCDSFSTLLLTVNGVDSTDTTTAYLCPNTSGYIFNGISYSATGIYTQALQTVTGCDSFSVLNLFAAPAFASDTTIASICYNNSYTFIGQNYDSSGVYSQPLVSSYGCDSIAVLALTEHPMVNTDSVSAAICQGDTLSFGSANYTAPGTYSQTFVNVNQCDSTSVLTLSYFPKANNDTTYGYLCPDMSFIFNGVAYLTTGIYHQLFADINGCDSTSTLVLDLASPDNTDTTNATICSGTNYNFNGATYSSAGVYTQLYQSSFSCDSFSTLILDTIGVNTTISYNAENYTLNAVNMAGATYQWLRCPGYIPIAGATSSTYTVSNSGDYAVAITVNGCTDTSACLNVLLTSLVDRLHNDVLKVELSSNNTILHVESSKAGEINFFDAQGKLVVRAKVNIGLNFIPVQAIAKGVYLISLSDQQGRVLQNRKIRI
jgi:hypothetical protein